MSATASAASAVSGSAFMSVRGTMTSRTIFSAKSETASSSASSASSRSASSSCLGRAVLDAGRPTATAALVGWPGARPTRHGAPSSARDRVERPRWRARAAAADSSPMRSGLATASVRGSAWPSANMTSTNATSASTISLEQHEAGRVCNDGADRDSERRHRARTRRAATQRRGRAQPVRPLRERLELRASRARSASTSRWTRPGGSSMTAVSAAASTAPNTPNTSTSTMITSYHVVSELHVRGQDETGHYRKNS